LDKFRFEGATYIPDKQDTHSGVFRNRFRNFFFLRGLPPHSLTISSAISSTVFLPRDCLEKKILSCFANFLLRLSVIYSSNKLMSQTLRKFGKTYYPFPHYPYKLGNLFSHCLCKQGTSYHQIVSFYFSQRTLALPIFRLRGTFLPFLVWESPIRVHLPLPIINLFNFFIILLFLKCLLTEANLDCYSNSRTSSLLLPFCFFPTQKERFYLLIVLLKLRLI